jgi:hypothetical protein
MDEKKKSKGSNKTKEILNAFLVCAQAPCVIVDSIRNKTASSIALLIRY